MGKIKTGQNATDKFLKECQERIDGVQIVTTGAIMDCFHDRSKLVAIARDLITSRDWWKDDAEYQLNRRTNSAKDYDNQVKQLQAQVDAVRKWHRKWAGMCIDLEAESELLTAINGDG